MRIAPEIVQLVWKRATESGRVFQHPFSTSPGEGVDIYGGPGAGHVLRSDGKVFEWEFGADAEVRYREADEHSATQGLVLGTRVFPELRAALPVRPGAAVQCDRCEGRGFVDFGQLPQALICLSCDGLGWRPAA
jgi:hypothetical protein